MSEFNNNNIVQLLELMALIFTYKTNLEIQDIFNHYNHILQRINFIIFVFN
jgi:hypothetical protein